jgi:transcription elongation factor
MAESKNNNVELNSKIIQMIVIDTINIYTREILEKNKLLNENFNKFFDEELDVAKYSLAESISKRYKEFQIIEN